jgi:hypothetical protein
MKIKHHPIRSTPMIQSGHKTLNNILRRRCFTFALSGLLFASLLALSPSQANAGCQQWDVTGKWHALQSNRSTVEFDLKQSGTQFTGTATGDNVHYISITGMIKGNRFKVSIKWRQGSDAVYTGTIDSNGKMTGRTSEYFSGAHATWSSDVAMKCADSAALIPPRQVIPKTFPKSTETEPTRPPPIKSSGKTKAAPTPAATPPDPH